MKLAYCTWQQVEEKLKTNKTIIIPIGSTEQHGPTGLIGTDYLTANAIASEVGKRTSTLVAPPLCVGMALHHLDFPGSMSLQPQTLIQVVVDQVESLKRHGFEKVAFVNGHGGNIATVTTAFSAIKNHDDETSLSIHNWWRLPEVQAYEKEHFGDQNGFHATVGEISVTMFTDPVAFNDIESRDFEIDRPEHDWPQSPKEFRKTFPDGRMESNPGLASKEHGEKLFEIAVDAISNRVSKR